MTFLYLARWFVKARFFGKRNPLQSVIFISDKCNLHCRHCNVVNSENPVSKSKEQIREELLYCYHLGSRFIDFEGGEPMIWRDGNNSINDLIEMARKIGFHSATVTTNAQLPFGHCQADSMWISMDGLHGYHDRIRGEGSFARLEENIDRSCHKKMSLNMVINSLNHENVGEAIEYARKHPRIQSISLNFHLPYKGTESLFLDWETRRKVIDGIIRMKKQGYPVMNSVSGLEAMKHNNFPKVCWVTNFILADGTRLTECAGKTHRLCDQCGLCMAGEMYSVFHFKPDTILAGLKLRV